MELGGDGEDLVFSFRSLLKSSEAPNMGEAWCKKQG